MSTTDEVPDEPTVQPNIDAIAKLIAINGPIQRAEEEGQNSRSNLGNYYKRIQDDYHGHRGAVKAVRKLLSMSATQRADYMRTFEPLAEHFNLFPSQAPGDMVDQAERETAKDGGKPAGANALEAAKAHLNGGTKDEAEPGGEAGPKAEPEVAAKAGAGKGGKGGKGGAKLGVVGGTDTVQ